MQQVIDVNESAWTRETISSALENNSFTYQNVSLPFGLKTGGKDRSQTAKRIFPDGLTSKSVFDVGCMYGYFCFAAEDRGAVGCVGVDIDPENVVKSSLLADIRGSSAQFRHLDIEADAVPGKFDYVLCLNVLHHLRNPLAVIDKLAAATRDSLVLEIASFSPRDRMKNGVSWLAGKMLGFYPVLFVAGGSTQTFFITAKAVRRLLLNHRFDFARVDQISEGHKGRFIAIARRRRIKRLVVIAGMPAGGKSTFMEHLVSPDGAEMARQMGIDPGLSWSKWLLGKFVRSEQQDFDNVILHYNICKHLIDGDLFHFSRVLTDLMAISAEVTVITVAHPRQELHERFKATRLQNTRKSLTSRRHRKKIDRLLSFLERPAGVRALYREWVNFLETRNIRNFFVTADAGSYRLCASRELVDDEFTPSAR
jgi:2-polyprenyl-3-methyl-5-hydroxy-6-metoxy-1,4-benzoquinol methylase